jgi:hypothetical protein
MGIWITSLGLRLSAVVIFHWFVGSGHGHVAFWLPFLMVKNNEKLLTNSL